MKTLSKSSSLRIRYAFIFAALLVTETVIALFVRDSFIRPYGGDVLVTLLICAFISMFFPKRIRFLPLWVFLFSLIVEVLQYFDFVSLLGLSHIPLIRIALGSVFSVADIVCYGVGCIVFLIVDRYCIK